MGTEISLYFYSVTCGMQWTDVLSVFASSLGILNHRQLGGGYTGPYLEHVDAKRPTRSK